VKTVLSPQRTTPRQSSHEDSYLVQFTFAELLEAQRWVDTLKEEGYVTSLNFVKKEDQPIHLRVGHFASISEATQFVDDFKAQGLHGLVLKGSK
jgi:cell division septation protein DedD